MTKTSFADHVRTSLRLCTIGACLAAATTPAAAQGAATPATTAVVSSELGAQGASALASANDLATDASQLIERWLATGAVNEDRLFDRMYFPIADTKPPKFTTSYDSLADRDFPLIQDKALGKSNLVVFAIITDVNGYVPTHNAKFTQAISGNAAVDIVNHRTKRLATDPASFRAGRNEAPYLFQQYRFNGEQVAEVSVPVRVRGRHFGAVRIAYRLADK